MACDTSEMLTIFYYAKIAKNVLFVIVPIIFIILSSLDYFRVITTGESDDLENATFNFMKRAILAGILVVLPFFINLILGISGIGTYDDCFSKATLDNIDLLRKKELEEWEKEKAKREAEEEAKKTKKLRLKTGTNYKSHNGMNFYEIIPKDAEENMPLVVFLHGDSQSNRVKNLHPIKFVESGKAYVNNQKFIFIAPIGKSGDASWDKKETGDKAVSLINYIIKEYKIDKKRVYITGFSRGACGVWRIVEQHPDMFAAAVSISGSGNITPSKWVNVATRAYAGSYASDAWAARPSKNNCKAINDAGGKCTYTEFNCDHGGTVGKAYNEDLFRWMLKQKRK